MMRNFIKQKETAEEAVSFFISRSHGFIHRGSLGLLRLEDQEDGVKSDVTADAHDHDGRTDCHANQRAAKGGEGE